VDLVLYDAMCQAIEQCHSVDEVKRIHNNAAAFAAAAKIANNTDAERKAVEIRVRAERHAGKLLADMQRTPRQESGRAGGQGTATTAGPSTYRQSIQRARIPERTAQRWQELAAVPRERFEAHMQSEEMPSARAIVASARERPQVSREALWLWGHVREFERNGMVDADPSTLLAEMTPAMRAEVRRLAPQVAAFMNRCTEEVIA
jgi:hypothetical protein